MGRGHHWGEGWRDYSVYRSTYSVSSPVQGSAGDTVVTAPAFPPGAQSSGETELSADSDTCSGQGWNGASVGRRCQRGTCPRQQEETYLEYAAEAVRVWG